MTEDELILSLCREAKEEGSEKDVINNFREKYRDQSDLIRKASQGDSKALRRLRWFVDSRSSQNWVFGRLKKGRMVIFMLDFKALFKYIEGCSNNMAAQKSRTQKSNFIEASIVVSNAVVKFESELSSIRQGFLTKKGDKS